MNSYNRLKKKTQVVTPTKWNRQSVILSIIISFFFFIMIFSTYVKWGDVKELFYKDKYQYTSGKIINYEAVKTPSQTRMGSRIITKYNIEYSYSVSGKIYEKKELIDENPNFIKRIVVSYNIDNPNNASIAIE